MDYFGVVEQMQKVSYVIPSCTTEIRAKLRELGLYTFVRWGYIFIAPPLIINETQIDEGLAIISEALKIADEYVN
jgi:taurine--2-oxoglutarate transaminase